MVLEYGKMLAETLPRVRERMESAAHAAGRPSGSVRLVAVTKGHPLAAIRAALDAGLRDLGENRVGELERKAQALGSEEVRWHMIGHLQRRKAPRAAELADLIHSVDSNRLAERLSRVAGEEGPAVRILAQVNTSGEQSKGGYGEAGAVEEIHRVAELPGLRVEGLMTMAPLAAEDPVLARTFRRLREISETLRSLTDEVGPELSMGMTNDMEIAIREGSTLVRIGTALFGERVK